MKKLLLFLLIGSCTIVKAQGFGDSFSMRGGTSYLSFNDIKNTVVGELELNINFYDYFSLDYRIAAGRNYFHSPLTTPIAITSGLLGVAAEDSNSLKGLYVLVAIAALAVPEGISAHIPIGKHSYLSPTLSPLGFEYLGRKNDSEKQKIFAAGNFGLKYDHFLDENWFFSLQGIFKIAYSREYRSGVFFGIQLGKVVSW